MTDPSRCSVVSRRFLGAVADELTVHIRPPAGIPGIRQQARSVYRALAAWRLEQGVEPGELTSETLFLRDIRRDLVPLFAERGAVLSGVDRNGSGLQPTVIEQPPGDGAAAFELLAGAAVARDPQAQATHDVAADSGCPCGGCALSGARLLRRGDETTLRSSNLYGRGRDRFEQALDMFRVADRLLRQCGMEFSDVDRTWIQLRHIDRDYDVLNRARRAFFAEKGVEVRPASTAVGGTPFSSEHDFSLSLDAVHAPGRPPFERMSAATLNEAWSYGADFSRGLRVATVNDVVLWVSGTASIDEVGSTVHVGDFDAQVARMLRNIEALLARQRAAFSDVQSAVTYLKHGSAARRLLASFRRDGFDGFPCAIVEAPLCRRDLLCETEVVARLPLSPSAA